MASAQPAAPYSLQNQNTADSDTTKSDFPPTQNPRRCSSGTTDAAYALMALAESATNRSKGPASKPCNSENIFADMVSRGSVSTEAFTQHYNATSGKASQLPQPLLPPVRSSKRTTEKHQQPAPLRPALKSTEAYQKMLQKAAKQAGLKDITINDRTPYISLPDIILNIFWVPRSAGDSTQDITFARTTIKPLAIIYNRYINKDTAKPNKSGHDHICPKNAGSDTQYIEQRTQNELKEFADFIAAIKDELQYKELPTSLKQACESAKKDILALSTSTEAITIIKRQVLADLLRHIKAIAHDFDRGPKNRATTETAKRMRSESAEEKPPVKRRRARNDKKKEDPQGEVYIQPGSIRPDSPFASSTTSNESDEEWLPDNQKLWDDTNFGAALRDRPTRNIKRKNK